MTDILYLNFLKVHVHNDCGQSLNYQDVWRFARFDTICTTRKNVKNTHGRVILLVKLQVSACNFTKSITLPWVSFTFFELYKWWQIAQSLSYFRKTGWACGMSKKDIFKYMAIRRWNLPKQQPNVNIFECENAKEKVQKGHCMQVLHTISVEISLDYIST